MKRLKIFGLLAMVALLAFGLALSCDSSTPEPDEPGSPAPVAHYSLDGGRLGLYFSQDPSRLPRATATSAEEGDHYVLIEELSRRVLSAGLATVGGNAITLKPDQTEFAGQADFTAEVSSDGGISVLGAPDGAGGTIGTITGEREGSGAYQPGGNQGGQGNQGGTGPGGSNNTGTSKYTITFNPDGGSPTPAPVQVTAGDALGALPTAPKKADYEFAGWYTAINGGGAQVLATYVPTASITVYAKWAPSVWAGLAERNAALMFLQITDPTNSADAIAAEVAALQADVRAAFKDASVQDWVTGAALSTVYPEEKFPDGSITFLYFVAAKVTPANFAFGNLPLGVSIKTALTGQNATTKGTATLEYKIGNVGADSITHDVWLTPHVEYEVVFVGGATGTIKILDDVASGGNGTTLTFDENSTKTTGVGVIGGTTTITVSIPASSMVTAVRSDDTTLHASFPMTGAKTNQAVAITSTALTSDSWTITVRPAAKIVTFNDNIPVSSGNIYISDGTVEVFVTQGGAVGTANMPANPRAGGYVFDRWNTEDNGTGGDFTATTPVIADTSVYAIWKPITDTNAPWGVIADMNNVIKLMTDATAKATAIDELEAAITDAFDDAKDGDDDAVMYTWFNAADIIAGSIDDSYQTDGVSFDYLSSAITGTGAARKIRTTDKLPAGVTVGGVSGWQLLANPTSTATDTAKPGLHYIIGNNDAVVDYILAFRPVTKFTVAAAPTGATGNITITDGATTLTIADTATGDDRVGYLLTGDITFTLVGTTLSGGYRISVNPALTLGAGESSTNDWVYEDIPVASTSYTVTIITKPAG